MTEGVHGVFSHAKLGMLPATYSAFRRMLSQSPQFPLHLATIPTIDGGQPSNAADVIYAFSPQQSTSPEPEGSWQFIKWLATNPDAQAAMIAVPSAHEEAQGARNLLPREREEA